MMTSYRWPSNQNWSLRESRRAKEVVVFNLNNIVDIVMELVESRVLVLW